MRRPKLPKQLLENTKKLLKIRKRSRSKSPAAREPFKIPDAFKIPHPHAVHKATEDNPPPSHILLRGAPDGGLRQILRPENHKTRATDPVGIIICSCNNPEDPEPTDTATAQLFTWNELEGEIPTLHKHQHFVASNTIFLQEFETHDSEGKTHIGPPYLVAIPTEISQSRSLENTNQEDLTKILDNIIKDIPVDDTNDTTQEDHIYMKLLNLPENPYYEEIQESTAPPPPESPQAILIWAVPGYGNITKNLNMALSELNGHPKELTEFIPDNDVEDDNIDDGAYLLTKFGSETQVMFNKDKNVLTQQRDPFPTITHNNLRFGIISNYKRLPSTMYVAELEARVVSNLTAILSDPTLSFSNFTTEEKPQHQTQDAENTTSTCQVDTTCPQCGLRLQSIETIVDHMKTHIDRQVQRRSRSRHRSHRYQDRHSDDSTSPHTPPRRSKGMEIDITESDTITPAFLELPETPETFRTYFAMIGRTRTGYPRYAAPHFPPRIRTIEVALDFPGIPERELRAWAGAYDNFADRSALDYQATRRLQIKIHNSLVDLQSDGKKDIIAALKTNAPVLATHQVADLTHQTVTEFFEAARTYCLVSGIEWTDIYHFTISARTVGDEIHRKIQTRLQANPNLRPTAITISTYLEKILLDLLPTQMTYSEKFDIIVAQHKNYLTAAVPSTDYMRQNLDVHAAELQYLHPTYRQAQGTSKGWSTEESAVLCNMIIDTLQERIISDTRWKTELTRLYITSPHQNYHKVPRAEVLNDLTKIIEATTTNIHTAGTKGPPKQQKKQTTNQTRRDVSHQETRQDKCDICYKADLPCKARPPHCKMQGHQTKYVAKPGKIAQPSNDNIQRAKRGEKVQIAYKDCTKCKPGLPVANVNQTPPPQSNQGNYTNTLHQHPPPNITIQQNPDRRRPPPPSPPYSGQPHQNRDQNIHKNGRNQKTEMYGKQHELSHFHSQERSYAGPRYPSRERAPTGYRNREQNNAQYGPRNQGGNQGMDPNRNQRNNHPPQHPPQQNPQQQPQQNQRNGPPRPYRQ